MPFLTIAGITVEVESGAGDEQEVEEGVEDTRAHAGNLRTVVGYIKRTWEFTSGGILTQAQYNTLRAAVTNGAHVACNGDALDNVAKTCRVRITSAPYIDPDGVTFQRVARLRLIEV